MTSSRKLKVMIAGIGGASLGTELLKCLKAAGGYAVFGCDISRLAYGHYMPGFEQTYVVNSADYLNSIVEICKKENIGVVIPGGEQPLQILNNARSALTSLGITLAANSAEVIETFTDKRKTFDVLSEKGFAIPLTIEPKSESDFCRMKYPCVIKPSTGSGGSDGVVIVSSKEEALRHWRTVTEEGRILVLQEYISHNEGEFSLGVLSLPNFGAVGSIALKKVFESKIALHSKSACGIVSSPYSSGLIEEFAELRQYAESIADAIGSIGPLNIQGRLQNGIFLPFEINPRFSGSEYIRTMAGFNQLDIFLTYLQTGEVKKASPYRTGYYIRSLTEAYVPVEDVRE